MTKSKSTKRALLLSVLTMLVCCAMLIGSTFAWFTDSVSTSNNKIVAGNLDVELKVMTGEDTFVNVEEQENLFSVNLWEPGVVAYETFKAINAGDLALKYNLFLSYANANAIEDKTLADVIKVAVIDGALTAGTSRDDLVAAVKDDLKTIDTSIKAKDGQLDLEAEDTFTVVLYWEPTNYDNNYNVNNGKTTSDGQPLHIDFGVTLSATQAPKESDSFNDQYDKSAAIEAPVAVENAINQGAADSNALLAKEIGATDIIYFDAEGLKDEEDAKAITLNFKNGADAHINLAFDAIRGLIGSAVDEQAANIYSVEIGHGQFADTKVNVFNGQPMNDAEGNWVKNDLKALFKDASGLLDALKQAADNDGVDYLDVEIIDMSGNSQIYRMHFNLDGMLG